MLSRALKAHVRRRDLDVRRHGGSASRADDGGVAAGDAHAVRRRGYAARDRLPQRLEPAARARVHPAPRDGGAAGRRRRPRTSHPSAARGSARAVVASRPSSASAWPRRACRRSWRCSRVAHAGRRHPSRPGRRSSIGRSWSSPLPSRSVAARAARHRDRVPASRQEIRATLAEGTRSVAGGRTSRARAQSARDRSGGADDCAADRRRAADAQFRRRCSPSIPAIATSDALMLDLTWTFSREPDVQARRKDPAATICSTQLRACPASQRAGLINDFPLGSGCFPNGQFLEMTRVDEFQRPEDLQTLGDEVKARAGFAGLSHRERGLLQRDGHSAGSRPALRRARRSGRAARRGDQRIAGRGEVAEPGSARPLHPVRQHGRRPARLPHRRHRRRRARGVAGSRCRRRLFYASLPAAHDAALHRRAAHARRVAAAIAPAAREIVRRPRSRRSPVQTRTLEDALRTRARRPALQPVTDWRVQRRGAAARDARHLRADFVSRRANARGRSASAWRWARRQPTCCGW